MHTTSQHLQLLLHSSIAIPAVPCTLHKRCYNSSSCCCCTSPETSNTDCLATTQAAAAAIDAAAPAAAAERAQGHAAASHIHRSFSLKQSAAHTAKFKLPDCEVHSSPVIFFFSSSTSLQDSHSTAQHSTGRCALVLMPAFASMVA